MKKPTSIKNIAIARRALNHEQRVANGRLGGMIKARFAEIRKYLETVKQKEITK